MDKTQAIDMDVTANKIAAALGVTRQVVDRRAKKGRWAHRWNGCSRVFTLSCLPPDVRAAVLDTSGPQVSAREITFRVRALRAAVSAMLREIDKIESLLEG